MLSVNREGKEKKLNDKVQIAVAAGAIFAFIDAPLAQEGTQGAELDEVIVTAQRREQSINEVPISLSVFSSQSIEDNMIDDVADYFSKSPNVSFMEGGTRSERSISIRGVSDIGGLTSSFAVYVDDFNLANGPVTTNDNNSNSSINPQLQDIERIEVLRGPQGTYFGRNSSGGALSITTKKPEPEFYAEARAGYSSFDTKELGFVVNTPVIEEKFFVRASIFGADSNGAVTNINPAGGRSDSQFLTLRLAGRALIGDKLTIDLSGAFTSEEQGFDDVVPSGVLNPSSAGFAGALGLTPPVLGGVLAYPTNTTRVDMDVAQQQESEFTTFTSNIVYDGDGFSFTSVTGYLDTSHDVLTDLDLSPRGFLVLNAGADSKTFSQEFRIQSANESGLQWTVGALYARDELEQRTTIINGSEGLPIGPPPLRAPGTVRSIGLTTLENTSTALFGELIWSVSDRMNVIVGGRYTKDEIDKVEDRGAPGSPLPTAAGGSSFSDFSPKFSLTFSLNETATGYVTVSKGYKAGGIQTDITSIAFPVTPYNEEDLWNYEVGLKMQALDNRLRLAAAIFYMDWTDLQVLSGLTRFDENGLPVFSLTTTNAANASSKGVEFEVTALLAESLQVSAGIGYLDAKYDDFQNAVIFGQTVDLTGASLPRAPKWTLNADSQYSFLMGEHDAFVRAEWNYRDGTIPLFESSLDPNFPNRTPSFSVVNLRAGIEKDRYRLSVFWENAFDEQYFTSLDPTFGFTGPQLHPSRSTAGVRFVIRTD